jgi:hypothetical protein
MDKHSSLLRTLMNYRLKVLEHRALVNSLNCEVIFSDLRFMEFYQFTHFYSRKSYKFTAVRLNVYSQAINLRP